MIEVFNAISNIAVHIENDVFKDYGKFEDTAKSDEEIHNSVYNHCRDIIETEFEKIRTIKGAISKDKKQYCSINEKGKYLISYVAVDNIDLLDVNFSLGSIFGIYENELEAKNLKAAIYITYGPTFQLVFASESEGVQFFSYEYDEFVPQEAFSLSNKGNINSTAGKVNEWSKEHKGLVDSFFKDGYRLRFSDSLALDTHQILFKRGGIYTSPSTKSHPDGLLELIFEAFPIAFIINLAKGEAINDKGENILDIKDIELHSKTPIYFGSVDEIKRVKEHIN